MGLLFFSGRHVIKGVTTAWEFAKVIFCVGMYGRISTEEPILFESLFNMRLGYPAAASVQDIWSIEVTSSSYSALSSHV